MLHHVEIYVSNLEEATSFWEWFLPQLGYELYQNWHSGRSWKFGPTYLVFVQTEPEHLHPPYDRRKTGLNHLAFHAESTGHVDEMFSLLAARNILILKDTRNHGDDPNYAVIFEGPDGILIEYLIAKKRAC